MGRSTSPMPGANDLLSWTEAEGFGRGGVAR